MRVTLKQLRKLILKEWADASSAKPMVSSMNDPLSPDVSDREQLGSLADAPIDDEENEISDHLMEPEEDPEDVHGPVPPGRARPELMQDPFHNQTSPFSTPHW